MMWFGTGNPGWIGWTLAVPSMTAFWALVVWAVIALVRSTGRASDSRQPNAEDILARRFAAGEIDAPAYRQSQAVLSGKALVDH